MKSHFNQGIMKYDTYLPSLFILTKTPGELYCPILWGSPLLWVWAELLNQLVMVPSERGLLCGGWGGLQCKLSTLTRPCFQDWFQEDLHLFPIYTNGELVMACYSPWGHEESDMTELYGAAKQVHSSRFKIFPVNHVVNAYSTVIRFHFFKSQDSIKTIAHKSK